MNQSLESIYLAWRDWKFEFSLSICAVLALASMLAPLLVLQGLKNGIIDGMRNRLLQDPAVLVITPKSDAGRYSDEFIGQLASLPGAKFAIGRTRDTATDMTFFNPAADKRASISLEPAAAGEPVLSQYEIPPPDNSPEPQIVLSTPAAKALGATAGSTLEAKPGRRTPAGKLESITLLFHVSAILPVEAADRKMAFVSLRLLKDLENYRDYLEVPARGLAGAPNNSPNEYASFRLYARTLNDVENLSEFLAGKNIEVITRAREIASIRSLETAINQVIAIISIAVGAGFAAFTISSVQSATRRKKRMLGMLRLLGFQRFSLMLYPLAQTLLTAAFGFMLSIIVYFCVSAGITAAFSGQGNFFCKLGAVDILAAAAAVILLSALSCARAAWQAASVEPSSVIREV